MADLFNQQISATYSGLLKTTSSGVLTSSLTQITDGRGNGSPLYISTAAINFYNAYSFPITDGTADQVLKTDGAGAITWQDDANSGTVTSVALSVPTGLTVTGSPITTNGTITIGGTLGVANGGTGATTLTGILLGNGTSAISSITSANDGYILTADGVGGYAFEVASGGDVNVSGTPVADQIAIWTNATTIKGDPTLTINATTHEILLDQPSNEPRDGYNYNIGGGNILATRGIRNVGFGNDNLNVVTNGNFNTAFGSEALLSNTDGSNNVSVGLNSMYLNTTGNNNTAIGHSALAGNSVSSFNTAIGSSSFNNATGSYNTGIGYGSGSAITTGSKNVIIGRFTGTTGESPTPVYDIRTSSNNIVISDGDGNVRQTFDDTGAATFSGNVGIGVTPTAAKLQVKGEAYFKPFLPVVISGGVGYYGTNLTLTSDLGATQGANRIWSRYTGEGSPAISFEKSTTAQGYHSDPRLLTYTETVRITGGGVLQANYGISFPTPSPASSGTPNASSVLDAYEEGTWTQTINSSGYTGVTYVTAETHGNYTRVGNIVTAFFYMRFSGTYVSGGSVIISGLPYSAPTNRQEGVVIYTNLALSNVPTAYPISSHIYLYTLDVGSAGSFVSPTADANTRYLVGSVTYGI